MADGANTLERANATAGASEDDVPINWTGVVSIVVSCSLRLHMVDKGRREIGLVLVINFLPKIPHCVFCT